MEIPSYSEFLKTLTPDDYAEIGDVNPDMLSEIAETASSSEALGTQIASISLMISTHLLSRYHEWLVEQLSK